MPDALSSSELADLRRVAEAATPGPWWGEGVWWEFWTDAEGNEQSTQMLLVGHGLAGTDVIARVTGTDEDREHIATFDPPTVLRLLDQIATARREGAVEALRDMADGASLALSNEVGGHTSVYSVRKWLKSEADRIAGESSGE